MLIDIPIDVQNAQLRRFQYPEKVSLRTYKPTVKGHAVQIKKMMSELEKAKRPVICAGGGVLLCGRTGAFAGVFSQIPCAGRNNNEWG